MNKENNKLKINNIIFDFNGTILDDGYLCFDIEDKMIKGLGLPSFSYEFYRDHFIHPVSEYYKLIGIDENKYDYKKLNAYFFSEYSKRNKSEAKLFNHVKETLSSLKNKGYNLYILSATEINLLKSQLSELGIINDFNDIIASSSTDSKGKGEYGLDFAKRYNLDKSNAILIGDTTHDYDVSKLLNVNCLLFSLGHNSFKRLKDTGMDVVSSYEEIENYIDKLNTY